MASKTGIVKVNIANPGASTMHIAMNSVSVFAMAVISVDCNLNKVYAMETVQAGDATDLIELDMVNRRVVGVACRIPFSAADAASDVEGGTFSGISINEINVIPQCKVPGKGEVRVIREPGLAVYTYTLNGARIIPMAYSATLIPAVIILRSLRRVGAIRIRWWTFPCSIILFHRCRSMYFRQIV